MKYYDAEEQKNKHNRERHDRAMRVEEIGARCSAGGRPSLAEGPEEQEDV